MGLPRWLLRWPAGLRIHDSRPVGNGDAAKAGCRAAGRAKKSVRDLPAPTGVTFRGHRHGSTATIAAFQILPWSDEISVCACAQTWWAVHRSPRPAERVTWQWGGGLDLANSPQRLRFDVNANPVCNGQPYPSLPRRFTAVLRWSKVVKGSTALLGLYYFITN